MAGYVELHAHSCWSLREGASSTDELVTQALRLGYEAMAVTDHDNLYGAMEYAQGAKARGLRPITGCELTLVPSQEAGEPSHITVLAATVEGYRNLCRLLSRAHTTYGKDEPRVEKAWLFEWHEGLIVLSGCAQGELSRLCAEGAAESLQAAERIAGEYLAVFGDRFYVELQHHDVYGDTQRVATLAALAGRLNIPVVATNNAHYHVRERHRLHDALVAVRHRLTLDSSHAVRRANSEYFLKSADEMERRFAAYPGAVANTVAIAERCTFDLTQDLPYRLPDYPTPEGSSMDEFLRGICERAFERKYTPLEPATRNDARARLERELELIAKHGLAGFFLVYWEILQLVNEIAQEVKDRDPRLQPDERPVGRGRGSSVSSVVCYLIGLSHIDPVTNDLYLERFLNDELHSLPDIDMDFPREIRDELLKRIYSHFGEEHAALVSAFPTYRMRAAVQDFGKVLGLPAPTLAKLSKLGDAFASAEDVERQAAHVPELRAMAGTSTWQYLADLCHDAAGFPRHISQHVGGVVISAEVISSVVPIEPTRMPGRYLCQWDKDSIDDGRLVKIDFLALGMLSAVDDCLGIIEETRGTRIDLGRIDHASPEIYASIQAGDTMGTFQIESRAQIQTLPRTQPRTLDDLAVQVAIIRPGPIVAGAFRPYMEYREKLARGEPVHVDYGHPELEPLVKDFMGETLGHVLYQDQVLQMACAVAGFTPGQADRVRRAMSRKRSNEAMQELAEEFYTGATQQGVSREAATVAFERMAAFAAFGFPKSHAVAFALLAYESCWLRYYHPAEYYCSLFNSQPMGFYSIEVLTGDVKRHGVEVLSPCINRSRQGAWPEERAIRLGLDHVQGMGGGWAARRGAYGKERKQTLPERIIEEREAHGPYRSVFDLVHRAQLQRDTAEALIKADALREFGLERRELLWQLGLIFPGKRVEEKKGSGKKAVYQAALALPTEQDMVQLPGLAPWEELAWDYAATGVSERAHPMALVRPLLHEGLVTSRHIGGIGNDNRLPDGMPVAMAGMVVTRQRPQTASGVMFMLLEDEFGLVNIVVWPSLQERQRELVRSRAFVIIRGRIDNESSGFPNIIAEEFQPCPMPGLLEAPVSHDYG